ncbi:3601_t:CDS:2 [Funneliformis geosporum]|nr:3601_t:CDS:2 [Funneliformis geosporum]
MDEIQTRIADVGIHGPVDRNNSNDIYGVLPYVAPEVLKGSPLSKASDIYSFGMIMWILAAGVRPWCNRAHDLNLAKEICSGLRPEIPEETPYIYIQLMEQCWDPDPSNRPSALHLCCMFEEWTESFDDSGNFDADPVQRLEDSDFIKQDQGYALNDNDGCDIPKVPFFSKGQKVAFHLMSTPHNFQESTATSNETISHEPSSPPNNMSVINNNQPLQDTQNTQSTSQETEWSFYYRPNNDQQQQLLEFSNRHKENLEFHLRQFLTDNLVSNSIGGGSNSSLINDTFQAVHHQ